MTPIELFKHRRRPGEVGIEIEVEGDGLYKGKMVYWKAIRDGSLRGKDNAEYVLSAPVKRKDVTKVLQYFRKTMIKNLCVLDLSSQRTSVHVHINVQDIDFTQIINYFCLYSIFEDALVKWCGANREGNLFCLRLKDASYLIDHVANIVATGSWYGFGSNDIRYASINMAAIHKYGSMEFRAMRGTVDIGIINTWVCMLLQLKDKACLFNNAKSIIEQLSHGGELAFLEDIMGRYAKKIMFPGIALSIRDGFRRIQEIAYIPIVNRANPLFDNEQPELV